MKELALTSLRRRLGFSFRGRRRDGLLACCAALLHRRLAIALFEGCHSDGQDEFLLAVVIEFDNDMFFVAGEHGT